MEGANAVVDLIESVEEGVDSAGVTRAQGPEGSKLLSVRFAEGHIGLLDLAEPRAAVWASVLRSLNEHGAPAYVEIDPRTAMIVELLQPKLQPVGEIRPLDKGPDLEVQLLKSHARHVLRREHPRFQELLKLLRSAQGKETELWVTDTLNTHEIIDVRPSRVARE
jgi:hypothetical protein